MSNADTYTLEEVAERTGLSLEAVREAVDAGTLSLTQTSDAQEQRVTGVELERWWEMAKEHERIEERPDEPLTDSTSSGETSAG